MTIPELTDRQKREIAFFADHKSTLTEVNFDILQRPARLWRPQERIIQFARDNYRSRDQRLLSYGCGRGRRSLIYAQIGYTVYGFDIAPNRIENAIALATKYQLSTRTTFTVETAEKLSYPDSFFDYVVGAAILHHVDIEAAIPELVRVLKPGGIAFFYDSLATPKRDRIRNSKLVTWLVPLCDEGTADEHALTRGEIEMIRNAFSECRVERYRVLAVLARGLGMMCFRKKQRLFLSFLQKLDHCLFRIAPCSRRLGDEVCIILKK